jgi:hypothetical protein
VSKAKDKKIVLVTVCVMSTEIVNNNNPIVFTPTLVKSDEKQKCPLRYINRRKNS